MTHKSFVLRFCEALERKSVALTNSIYPNLRIRVRENVRKIPTMRKPKRSRPMSKESHKLPEKRLEEPKEDYKMIRATHRRRCIYCAYQNAVRFQNGFSASNMQRVQLACSKCHEHLYEDHFIVYHEDI